MISKRTKLLQVKLTPEEKASMQRQSQAEGDSHVSSWARRILVARATTPAVRALGELEHYVVTERDGKTFYTLRRKP